MTSEVRVLEQLTLVAPAGFMFWDTVTQAPVADGLHVIAYRAVDESRQVQAYVNPSGVWVLGGLPNLRGLEFGDGDDQYWATLPFVISFVVQASDQRNRFLPVQLKANLPNRGMFQWQCLALGTAVPPLGAIPLYSAATRAVPAGMAAVRADLWDSTNNKPAAWAVLDISFQGKQIARAVADEAGHLLVIFAYPPLDNSAAAPGAPPSPPTPMWQQIWKVGLQVSYAAQPVSGLPDWCGVLSQPAASMWSDTPNGNPLTETTLSFGQKLVLKSQGSKQSQLFIS